MKIEMKIFESDHENNNNNEHVFDINQTNDLESRVRVRRAILNNEGKMRFGISHEASPKIIPDWYDPEALRRAQTLFRIYGGLIHISQFYGLKLVLTFYEAVTPLLVTGNSTTVSKLYIRYLSTMMHVENWFTCDPFNPNSKSYRSLKIVRGLHRQVATKLNKISKLDPSNPKLLWMSQWSMCHAQFAFMGFMTVFGRNLGYGSFSPSDYHAMFHFWRVIGHCLGIDDNFNLCSGSDEEIFEICRQCYYEEWLPAIKSGKDKVGIEMARGIALSMFRVVPFVRFNVLLKFAAPFFGLDRDDYPLKSIYDYFNYSVIWFTINWSSRTVTTSWIISMLVFIFQRISLWMRKLNGWILNWKFDHKYETDDRCPFHVEISYQNAIDLNLHSNFGHCF